MRRLVTNMIRWALGILLVVLAWASADAQIRKPVRPVTIYECDVLELSVVDMPGDEYTWDFYIDSTANFALEDDRLDPATIFQDGDYRDESTVVVNHLDPGRYFLRVIVWDEVHCTNNILLFNVNVLPHEMYLEIIGDSVCEDELAQLKVIFTGTPPWKADYTFGDGTVILNMNGTTEGEKIVPAPWLPVGTHEFWIMELSDGCIQSYPIPNPQKGRVVIYPRPVSTKIFVNDK